MVSVQNHNIVKIETASSKEGRNMGCCPQLTLPVDWIRIIWTVDIHHSFISRTATRLTHHCFHYLSNFCFQKVHLQFAATVRNWYMESPLWQPVISYVQVFIVFLFFQDMLHSFNELLICKMVLDDVRVYTCMYLCIVISWTETELH